MNVNDYEDIPDISDEIRHYQNYLNKFSGGFGNQADAIAYNKWSNEHPIRDIMYGFAGKALGPFSLAYDGIEGLAEGLANSRAESGTPSYERGAIQGLLNVALPRVMKGTGKALTQGFTRPGLFNSTRVMPAVLPISRSTGGRIGETVGNGLVGLVNISN